MNSTLFGLSIDESEKLDPEQSITAFVIYHAVASAVTKYFSA